MKQGEIMTWNFRELTCNVNLRNIDKGVDFFFFVKLVGQLRGEELSRGYFKKIFLSDMKFGEPWTNILGILTWSQNLFGQIMFLD